MEDAKSIEHELAAALTLLRRELIERNATREALEPVAQKLVTALFNIHRRIRDEVRDPEIPGLVDQKVPMARRGEQRDPEILRGVDQETAAAESGEQPDPEIPGPVDQKPAAAGSGDRAGGLGDPEEPEFSDRKPAARFERVRDFIVSHQPLFVTQGVAVAAGGWPQPPSDMTPGQTRATDRPARSTHHGSGRASRGRAGRGTTSAPTRPGAGGNSPR